MNAPTPRGRLTRVSENRMLGGVCAGIAKHYNIDMTVVRIVMVLLALLSGTGIVLYIALWILMPTDDAPAEVSDPSEASVPTDGASTPDSSATSSSAASLGTTAEEIAERARRAADELQVAARAATEAARVAADQLAEVARAATAAGRESWEQQRAQRTPPAPPETEPAAEVFASPDREDMPGTPTAASEIVTAEDSDEETRRAQEQQQQQ